MKLSKRILAGVFALSTAMSVAACGNSGSSGESSSEIPIHELTEDQTAVIDKFAKTLPDLKFDNKEVKWLSHYNINPTDGQSKSADIYIFEEKYGGKLTWVQSTWNTRYDDLAKLVMAKNSPDMFPADDMDTFPMGAIRAMFQPIDQYINLEDDLWKDTKKSADAFYFNGGHYTAVINVQPNYACIYNTACVDEAGLDQPAELFEKGEWNWDTFEEMCLSFTDAENDKYALDGYWYGNAISETCGVPLIGIKDGKVVQNLGDPAILEIQERMYELQKNNVVFPRAENNWAPRGGDGNGEGLASHLTLFYPMGLWGIEADPEKTKQYGDVEAGEIMFVPMPTNPKGDTYYVSSRVHGFNLCMGAPNPEGFAAFCAVQKYCDASEDIKKIGDDQLRDNYKWTDEMIEMRHTLYDMAAANPVFDFQNGVSPDISSTMQNVSQASMISGGNQITWTECRETYETGLQYYIDKENKSIADSPSK